MDNKTCPHDVNWVIFMRGVRMWNHWLANRLRFMGKTIMQLIYFTTQNVYD